jgi:hypothetical protein
LTARAGCVKIFEFQFAVRKGNGGSNLNHGCDYLSTTSILREAGPPSEFLGPSAGRLL